MTQSCVVIGHLHDGFEVVGPFESGEAAAAFADAADERGVPEQHAFQTQLVPARTGNRRTEVDRLPGADWLVAFIPRREAGLSRLCSVAEVGVREQRLDPGARRRRTLRDRSSSVDDAQHVVDEGG